MQHEEGNKFQQSFLLEFTFFLCMQVVRMIKKILVMRHSLSVKAWDVELLFDQNKSKTLLASLLDQTKFLWYVPFSCYKKECPSHYPSIILVHKCHLKFTILQTTSTSKLFLVHYQVGLNSFHVLKLVLTCEKIFYQGFPTSKMFFFIWQDVIFHFPTTFSSINDVVIESIMKLFLLKSWFLSFC